MIRKNRMLSAQICCSAYAANVTCQVWWSGRDFGICIRGQLKESRADDRTGQSDKMFAAALIQVQEKSFWGVCS